MTQKLTPNSDKVKCAGTGCNDKNRCGRYLRPDGMMQAYSDFLKSGINCQFYESVDRKYHINDDDEPARTGW